MMNTTLVSVVAGLVLTGVAGADVITVDDNGPADFDTIQAAINAASSGDVIVVSPGIYTSEFSQPVADMKGKAVILTSLFGPENTFIDGEFLRQGIVCTTGEWWDTIIEGFTIQHCNGVYGGGFYNNASSPTIINCMFRNNTATGHGCSGGGMFSRNYSRPILVDCTFEGNLAEDGPGGGMSNYTMSSPTLIDCTFSNNFSTDHSGNGGGMSNSQAASPTLLNCTFTGNAAVGSSSKGGGMFSTGEGSMELYDCTFIDNHATDSGGGMVNLWDCSPLIVNCTFTGNTAGDGGGLYNYVDSIPHLVGCTFSGNSAIGGPQYGCGGGVFNYSSRVSMTSCVFSGNTADAEGGAMYSRATSSVDSPTLTNCVLTGNTAKTGGGMYNQFQVTPVLAGTVVCGNGFNQIFPEESYEDAGGNTITDECDGHACPADLDGNGVVDQADLAMVLGNWGGTTGPADINLDRQVDGTDLGLVLASWGTCQ